MIDLNTIWFLLIGVLITGYAILDGFDFGVGILHLFTKNNTERRLSMNSIGPVWDGNEVWLLTAGGAMFAAFPIVYATVFSGFYIALMLLLTALIARAVSLEFRGKVDSPKWRNVWDWSFGLGSLLPPILLGVAVGNILRGVPVNADGMYAGTFLGLLNPFSIMVGLLSLTMFVMQGALYLSLKVEGDFQARVIKNASSAWIAFIVLYFLTTLYTFFEANFLFIGMTSAPLFWVFFIMLLGALIYVPIAIKAQKYFRAFLSSSLSIASLIGVAAVSLYPRLVPSSIDLAYSLTIYNASSTPKTLTTMLIITLIALPFVLGYTVFIYRIFKGKTVITSESY
ncbi:MAG: cytochrome d ubiquinol oxidase subunit II [bacterium]